MIALLRLGRREAWRHKLRSTLVLLLILVPVALSSAVLVLVPAVSADLHRQMTLQIGDAQARVVTSDGAAAPADAPWIDPAVRGEGRVLEGAAFTAWMHAGDDGLVSAIAAEQVDPTDPMVAPKYDVAAGRLPEAPGEVTLDRASMRRFGLDIGDTFSLALPAVELTVVGELSGPGCRGCGRAVMAPGSVERPAPPSAEDPLPAEWTSVTWQDEWYLDGFPTASIDAMERLPFAGAGLSTWSIDRSDRVDASGDDPDVGRAWTVAGAAFLLLWTGLVAASGLAVGARRRKRELGLLAANGADPAGLRLAVVAEGLVLGAIGAAIGVAVGAVAARIIEPHVRVDTLPRALPIPWGWLGLVWVIGTLAAVVAAWSASVGVASLTPSQLLRGHRPTPRPAPAWFAAGVVLFIGGCVVLRVGREANRSSYGTTSIDQLVVALGVLVATLGVIAVVVGATRIAGRLTGSAPTSVRIAGRDLARHGVRIAAATAAVALTLTGATALATYQLANVDAAPTYPVDPGVDEAADAQLLEGGPDVIGQLFARENRLIDGRVLPLTVDEGTVASLSEVAPLVGTMRRYAGLGAVQRCFPGFVDDQGRPAAEDCQPVTVAVADDAMLDLLPPGVADLLRDGSLVANGGTIRDAAGVELPAELVHLGLWAPEGGTSGSFGGAEVLVSSATAAGLGVDRAQPFATDAFVALEDSTGRDALDRDALEREVRGLGFGLSTGSWVPPTESVWSAAKVFAVGALVVAVVTLLIVMITLALIRVESRSDDDVLLIAGAAPGLSRRVSAARAGLIVLAAALPATLAGWSVARALMIGSSPTPWAAVVASLVVLPLLAATLGWLFHRPPRRLALQ